MLAEIRREMERLRPVYETGVLRLLLRANSMLYVALLRSTFDPLTGELPREIVEERFARSLNRLIETGDYTLKDGQTTRDAAHSILLDLTREGEGDYAWLANSMDVASHRYLYRLTARAHRAIEALDRLEDTTKALSGAQANSIIMEIENARMQLTADPRERIRLLKKDIEERQKEIDKLEHSEALEKLTSEQIGDIIGVIHNTLRGVPIDLRELALSERDNGDALRRRMQAGALSVESILTAYHDEYRRAFRESDSGRRFEDAFQVIVTDEGRREIDDAVRDIARNPYWMVSRVCCSTRCVPSSNVSTRVSKTCAGRSVRPMRRSAVLYASKRTPAIGPCSPNSTSCSREPAPKPKPGPTIRHDPTIRARGRRNSKHCRHGQPNQ